MQNLKQLQCFIQVAELNSFKQAAEKMFLTTTAVSKHIKNLEAELDEQLFIRSTRHVELTELGKQFYQRCKVLEKNMNELKQFVHNKKSEPQGKLRICAWQSLGRPFLMKKLKAFHQAYPKIELDIEFIEKTPDVEKEHIDILFFYPLYDPVTQRLSYRKLTIVNNVLCASPEFIKQYGKPKKPEDLVNLPLLNHTLRQPNNVIKLPNNKSILASNPTIRMNSFEALTEACEQGLGILLTSDTLVEQQLKEGKLIALLPEVELLTYEIYMFYKPMTYKNNNVRAFVDFYSEDKNC
jgi:DNA-binding transcriptional LysR family regulator